MIITSKISIQLKSILGGSLHPAAMRRTVIDDELLHVAKLPPPPLPLPPERWAQPYGRLHGRVVLPAQRGTHQIEALVDAMVTKLAPHVRNCIRLAIWRVPPCVALVLVPALRRLRVAAVWLSDRWREEEARYALSSARTPAVLTTDESITHLLPSHFGILRVRPLPAIDVCCLRGCDSSRLQGSEDMRSDESMYFTSGSGGAPKGVRLSHEAMDVQALEKVTRIPFVRGNAYLHLAPHFHVGGASSTLAALHAGMDHVVLTPSSLLHRAPQILDTIRRENVTVLVLVPGLLLAFVDAASNFGLSLAEVRAVLVGAAPTDSKLALAARSVFPSATLIAAYGLTECASSLAFAPLGKSEARAPVHVQLAVHAPCGGRGRIVTRGPHVMRGYLGEEERDVRTWLETGDLGEVTVDGELVVVGRERDVIRSGGESVDASEVERAIVEHEAVVLAVVVGVPHPNWGEAVVAAVKLQPRVPVQNIISHCRKSLAGFKVPRWVVEIDNIPISPLGKVLKSAVRDMLLRRLENQLTRMAKL